MAKTKPAAKTAAKKPASKPPAAKAKKPAAKSGAGLTCRRSASSARRASASSRGTAALAAPRPVDTAPLLARIDELGAIEASLRRELDNVRAQLSHAQAELKLAQTSLKERVDSAWATRDFTPRSWPDARAAAQQYKDAAEKAAEAARAETMVLRSEIERLRGQLHKKDTRPPTLQGIGEPAPTQRERQRSRERAGERRKRAAKSAALRRHLQARQRRQAGLLQPALQGQARKTASSGYSVARTARSSSPSS